MTNSRIKWRMVLGFVLLSGVASVLFLATVKHYSVRGRMERIEKGILRSEVVQLIGQPPGDYTTRVHFPWPGTLRYHGSETWSFDEGQLVIWFDENGSATEVEVHDVWRLDESRSLLKRMLRWAGIR